MILVLVFLGIWHSIIEDTLIFAALGWGPIGGFWNDFRQILLRLIQLFALGCVLKPDIIA
jgi:hypothetical protein